jgi:hypothetical protein
METLIRLIEGFGMWGWGAVMIVGCTAVQGWVALEKVRLRHAERMAMIQRGLRPDEDAPGEERHGSDRRARTG